MSEVPLYVVLRRESGARQSGPSACETSHTHFNKWALGSGFSAGTGGRGRDSLVDPESPTRFLDRRLAKPLRTP